MLRSQWAVNEAIKHCREEEDKINERIQHCRQILRFMRSPVKTSTKEEVSTAEVKDVMHPEELEEVQLLEQALAKALRVRGVSGDAWSSAAVGQEGIDGNESPQKMSASHMTKPGLLASKSTSKALMNCRGARRSTTPAASQQCVVKISSRATARGRAAVRPGPAAPARVRPDHPLRKAKRSSPAPTLGSQDCSKLSSLPVENVGTAEVSSEHCGTDRMPATRQGDVTAGGGETSALERDGVPSRFLSAWRTHSTKSDRLWDKIFTRVSHCLPERTEFKERLRATFPATWSCGSPMDPEAEVGWLALRSRALTHCYQTELQAARTSRLPGACWKEKYESQLMLEGLQTMVGDLLQRAERLKCETDLWDHLWSQASGCPPRSRWPQETPSSWPTIATLTYTSQSELKDLEGLRVRVALLQQEIELQQILSEAFSSCTSSLLSSKGHLSPSSLRDLYSLLGEGGLHFPAVVLDTEPD